MGVFAWFRQQRQWHRDHIAAFSLVVGKQADGLTLFQHQVLDAVSPFVERGVFKRVATAKGEGDYLVAPLESNGAELFIYPNEATIFGAKAHAWFEEWDYPTPSELIQSLVEECASRVA